MVLGFSLLSSPSHKPWVQSGAYCDIGMRGDDRDLASMDPVKSVTTGDYGGIRLTAKDIVHRDVSLASSVPDTGSKKEGGNRGIALSAAAAAASLVYGSAITSVTKRLQLHSLQEKKIIYCKFINLSDNWETGCCIMICLHGRNGGNEMQRKVGKTEGLFKWEQGIKVRRSLRRHDNKKE